MADRTWREGYVPGKAKKTIHLDDEVARALEIRAAQERVSQAEIVERALRKELGMVRKIDIAVIECGEGWMDRLTGWATYVADDATDEQILEQAIAEVENNDFDVMRDTDGGACEVTHYADGRIVANITIWPLISIINPWSKALVHINRSEVTAERLEAMAQLMEDDIREELHSECPDDPAEFFARYVERVGPERAGEVWFA